MKNILAFVCFLMATFTVVAQAPKLFKYQGIARDSTGNPVSNDTIALRISIHRATTSGTIVYQETHAPITNEFGSFNINIGGGIVLLGSFSTIPWNRFSFFQEIEMDINGGINYVSMGTSQYFSVPYALSSDTAQNGFSPFWIRNTHPGNDTAAVALIAMSNGSAPTIFAQNSGAGSVIYAEAANGVHFVTDSTGIEATGTADFQGYVKVKDSLRVTGPTSLNSLNVGGNFYAPLISSAQGNFSVGLTTTGLNVNGSANISSGLTVGGLMGPINGSLINGTQGNFSTSITANSAVINGNANVYGKLYVSDSISQIYTTLVNGTQANFNTSVTTNTLNVYGSGNISGSLNVVGNLTKGSGTFKIDHPVDPLNKFLYHSFVESPDMKNIYDGNIVTDAEGNATIELPEYFEALNRDFRYQLTCIGSFAQSIVSKKISNNKFQIKTDKPNIEVSWQVTGIRKDAFAEKNPVIVEVEKVDGEKGKYLYPDSFKKN